MQIPFVAKPRRPGEGNTLLPKIGCAVFTVLEDVRAEEFTFGAITDFETEPTDTGEASVIAPDGGLAPGT
jgi:hypothetical protein